MTKGKSHHRSRKVKGRGLSGKELDAYILSKFWKTPMGDTRPTNKSQWKKASQSEWDEQKERQKQMEAADKERRSGKDALGMASRIVQPIVGTLFPALNPFFDSINKKTEGALNGDFSGGRIGRKRKPSRTRRR